MRGTVNAMDEWQAASDASWREYEQFVLALRACNDAAIVEAYENDGDRESCYLSSLWVPFTLWKIRKATEWTGDKGRLILPSHEMTANQPEKL